MAAAHPAPAHPMSVRMHPEDRLLQVSLSLMASSGWRCGTLTRH